VLKFAEYAEAGIPRYWMVDLTAPVSLVAYVHTGNSYEPDGEFTGTAKLTVADTLIQIDLDGLVAR
jgi:Uma2 family endonuclease